MFVSYFDWFDRYVANYLAGEETVEFAPDVEVAEDHHLVESELKSVEPDWVEWFGEANAELLNGGQLSDAGAADIATVSEDISGPEAGWCDDNFWSSSFSAGNCNADNTEGYVSVPGYGPVDYGMG